MDKNINYEKDSEVIAIYIIEKCISYSIFEINKKDNNSKLSSHCYQTFTKKLLNSITYPDFIAYDKDEFSKNQNSKYFFDNVYYGENNWTGMIEPV